MEQVKKCKHCDCYSSAKADSCCWCGSKDLTFIDGVAEVEKEKREMAEQYKKDTKLGILVFGGFIISVIGSILGFIANPVFLIFGVIRLNNDMLCRLSKKKSKYYIWGKA